MTKKQRCSWCVGDDLYEAYHDKIWGVPVYNDNKLFEYFVLETFQAGLSWITVLKKHKNFSRALDNFNYLKIANYSTTKINTLLQDQSIIRNNLKINATVTNARAFIKIQNEYGSFSTYIWSFVNQKPLKHDIQNYKKAPIQTPLSRAISKALKQRGFKFVGATIVYAYMQAIGMVNAHEINCFKYNDL